MSKRSPTRTTRTLWLTLGLAVVIAAAFLLPTGCSGCELDTSPKIIIPPTPSADDADGGK